MLEFRQLRMPFTYFISGFALKFNLFSRWLQVFKLILQNLIFPRFATVTQSVDSFPPTAWDASPISRCDADVRVWSDSSDRKTFNSMEWKSIIWLFRSWDRETMKGYSDFTSTYWHWMTLLMNDIWSTVTIVRLSHIYPGNFQLNLNISSLIKI